MVYTHWLVRVGQARGWGYRDGCHGRGGHSDSRVHWAELALKERPLLLSSSPCLALLKLLWIGAMDGQCKLNGWMA